MTVAALETYLNPLKKIFSEEGVNEISINKPGEAWVEKMEDIRRELVPEFGQNHLLSLARLIVNQLNKKLVKSYHYYLLRYLQVTEFK